MKRDSIALVAKFTQTNTCSIKTKAAEVTAGNISRIETKAGFEILIQEKRCLMKPILLILAFFTFFTSLAGEEPIVLKTATGDLYGTLQLPEANAKVPVVLFISGSGPTDRNGNQPNLVNNSIKLLAESLAMEGIASVRFDKRGIAASSAALTREEEIRFEHYIEDVKAWITLLSTDSRFSGVHVAGHSEGALIATVACKGNFLVSSLTMMAGTGLPADQVLKEQLASLPGQMKEQLFPLLDKLKKGDTIANVPSAWYALLRPSVQPYLISWFAYDPAAELKEVAVPAMIVAGDKDIQVSVRHADILAEAKPTALKTIIPNMNHVLKECDSTEQAKQMTVYANPDLPVKADLVRQIVSFVKK